MTRFITIFSFYVKKLFEPDSFSFIKSDSWAYPIVAFLWKSIGVSFGLLASFLFPLWTLGISIIALSIIDMFVAWRANNYISKRDKNVKTPFQSGGVEKTIEKIGVYAAVLIAFRILEHVLMIDNIEVNGKVIMPLVFCASGLICLREVKSLVEKAESVTGVPLGEVLKKATKLFKSNSNISES